MIVSSYAVSCSFVCDLLISKRDHYVIVSSHAVSCSFLCDLLFPKRDHYVMLDIYCAAIAH